MYSGAIKRLRGGIVFPCSNVLLNDFKMMLIIDEVVHDGVRGIPGEIGEIERVCRICSVVVAHKNGDVAFVI